MSCVETAAERRKKEGRKEECSFGRSVGRSEASSFVVADRARRFPSLAGDTTDDKEKGRNGAREEERLTTD